MTVTHKVSSLWWYYVDRHEPERSWCPGWQMVSAPQFSWSDGGADLYSLLTPPGLSCLSPRSWTAQPPGTPLVDHTGTTRQCRLNGCKARHATTTSIQWINLVSTAFFIGRFFIIVELSLQLSLSNYSPSSLLIIIFFEIDNLAYSNFSSYLFNCPNFLDYSLSQINCFYLLFFGNYLTLIRIYTLLIKIKFVPLRTRWTT